MERSWDRRTVLDAVDGLFFVFSGAAAAWLAYVLLRDGTEPGWAALQLVVFWVLFSYFVLPRLHGVLTLIYVPDYFIGRARTSDGLLSDPIHLGLRGSGDQVHAAMSRSGWRRADEVGTRSTWRIITGSVRRHSYPTAPVSPLHLFGRIQDFAYQQEVAGNPARRHHVRFWRCPEGWLLPGGFDVDWLAAGTYDRTIGLSLFTLQVTHRIEEDTDQERDFVVAGVTGTVPEVRVEVLERFSSGYHARGGGGDRIRTDGNLPILDVRDVGAAVSRDAAPDAPRLPGTTVLGSGIALLRGAAYVVAAVLILAAPERSGLLTSMSPADPRSVAALAAGVTLAAAVLDIGLALAVLAGHSWARLLLMSACAVTAGSAAAAAVDGEGRPVGVAGLTTVGGSILVLLALSSRSARDHAVRTSPAEVR